ncbi:MAG: hypothetical protein Kow0069_32680 [Promethearchaeota archaeon]
MSADLLPAFLRQLYWLLRNEVPELETHLFADALGAHASCLDHLCDVVNEQAGRCLRVRGDAVEVLDPRALAAFASNVLDPREFANTLSWKQFEWLAGDLCEQRGFRVTTNFRFTRSTTKKRWELDLVGAKGDLALAVDAKRWGKGTASPAALKRAAREQRARVADLCVDAAALEKLAGQLGFARSWRPRFVVPALLLSRTQPFLRGPGGVAVVSANQFGDFLDALPVHFVEICHHLVRPTSRPRVESLAGRWLEAPHKPK